MKKLFVILVTILMFSSISEAQLKAPIDLRMDYHLNTYPAWMTPESMSSSSMGLSITNIGVYITNIGNGTDSGHPRARSDDPMIPTDYTLVNQMFVGRDVWNLWVVGGTYDVFRHSTLSVGFVYGNREQDLELVYESPDPFTDAVDRTTVDRTSLESHKGIEFGLTQRIPIMDFFDISLTMSYNSALGRFGFGLGTNFNILAKTKK